MRVRIEAVTMRLVRISSLDTSGTWSRGELEVECSSSELSRLCHLADVFHPELTVVQVETEGKGSSGASSVAVRVWFPPANRRRLDQLLNQRMFEVIPGLDLGLAPAVS